MRYAVFVTQNCNLRCAYCYVGKRSRSMPLSIATEVVDFAYAHTPPAERIEFGFFGGELLLEFPLVQKIADLIEDHPRHDPDRVHLSLVTNGTVLTPAIVDFVIRHDVNFVISCDGPPAVHDRFRRYPDGRGSGQDVAHTIRAATAALPSVPVNAVFAPETLTELPATVAYLSSLGVAELGHAAGSGAAARGAGVRSVGRA